MAANHRRGRTRRTFSHVPPATIGGAASVSSPAASNVGGANSSHEPHRLAPEPGLRPYPGYNLIVQPTPRDLRVGQLFRPLRRPTPSDPGRFSSEASRRSSCAASGTSTTMLHSDIQMRLAVVQSKDLTNTGDRTDLRSRTRTRIGQPTRLLRGRRPGSVDRKRPTQRAFHRVPMDVNASSAVYDEGFAQGVMDIHYFPQKRNLRACSSRARWSTWCPGPGLLNSGDDFHPAATAILNP